ncbi:MAG: exodeoxyribonuclease III [Humidesulfovibrio sp.]|nr:exodeoxyribonuclease III [Humidesulfovibrio sp.]
MRIVSWNVNGFRAALGKGFLDWLAACGADVVMLQETKVEPEQLAETERNPAGYAGIWNWSKGKKGYSGTACLAKATPLAHSFGLEDPRYRGEGRVIHMEYPDFHLFNIYFPNGQKDEERLAYKLGFYDAFLAQAEVLRKTKPIVVGGDFNTAHREIDLKNAKANEKTSGFLPIERAWIDKFIASGYVDTFRLFESGPDHYSWWSFRANARAKNVGWRIDYFFVSEELRGRVKTAWIAPEVRGSDHCPVGVEIL